MFKGILSLYAWRYPANLVALLQQQSLNAKDYLRAYWHTDNFDVVTQKEPLRASRAALMAIKLIRIGIILEIIAGFGFIALWRWHNFAGGLSFGLALIVAYPVVWGHLMVVGAWLAPLSHPRQVGKAMICRVLEAQVIELRKRNDFTVVAVVGSIGKTSTKAAIGTMLETSKRVMWQRGNYNDRLTVPLVFFDHELPNLLNFWTWTKIWFSNQRQLSRPYPYDIVVVELGTDGPNQIKEFAYTQPDLVVITGIVPEHMEYFGTLDAVAAEELSVLTFSKKALINTDDTPSEYLKGKSFGSYGLSDKATYHATDRHFKGFKGQGITFHIKRRTLTITIPLLGVQGAKIAIAAVAIADTLGYTHTEIEKGLAEIKPFSGRLQLLPGLRNSTLLDDTYNSAPVSTKAALDVLYANPAKQRIAILGSMNELGDYSPEAHREVGEYCDPKKIDLLITIGADARTFLAPVAEARGCTVKTFKSPYAAGKYAKKQLKDGAVVLAKGSQNGVFAEEALKYLLADANDSAKLVRQNAFWMASKRRQFSDDDTK